MTAGLGLLLLLAAHAMAQTRNPVAAQRTGQGTVAPTDRVPAQVSDRVIVLSPIVGTVVDWKERARFGFFPYVRDFQEAVFYETPTKTFYALIRRTAGPDTTIALTESVVRETGQAIERLAVDAARPAQAKLPVPIKTPAGADSAKHATGAVSPASGSLPAVPPQPSPKPRWTRAQDLLPFAGNKVPERYPRLGIGFGVGTYMWTTRSVQDAFLKAEDVYRSQGYSIPRRGVAHDPMQLMVLTARLDRTIDVSFQAAFAGNEFTKNPLTSRMRMIGGLLSGRLAPAAFKGVALFAGFGGGAYRFAFTNSYDANVSPYDSGGGVYVLEHITLKGGGAYLTTAGGVSFEAAPRRTIDVLVQYLGMGDVSTAGPHGTLTANLSSVIIGARLTIF